MLRASALLFLLFYTHQNYLASTKENSSTAQENLLKKEEKDETEKELEEHPPKKKQQKRSSTGFIYGGITTGLGLSALYGITKLRSKDKNRSERVLQEQKEGDPLTPPTQLQNKEEKKKSPFRITVDSATSQEDDDFVQDSNNLYDPNRPHKKRKKINTNRPSYYMRKGLNIEKSSMTEIAEFRQNLNLHSTPSEGVQEHGKSLTMMPRSSNLNGVLEQKDSSSDESIGQTPL